MGSMSLLELMDMKDRSAAAITGYEMAKRQLAGMGLAGGYVVCCDGIVLTFDLEEGDLLTNPRPCPPHQARSFSLPQAEAVAGLLNNQNGDRAEAVHVADAVDVALDAERAVLAFLYSIDQTQCDDVSTQQQVDMVMM